MNNTIVSKPVYTTFNIVTRDISRGRHYRRLDDTARYTVHGYVYVVEYTDGTPSVTFGIRKAGRAGGRDTWVVTHIPSGLKVGSYYESRKAAVDSLTAWAAKIIDRADYIAPQIADAAARPVVACEVDPRMFTRKTKAAAPVSDTDDAAPTLEKFAVNTTIRTPGGEMDADVHGYLFHVNGARLIVFKDSRTRQAVWYVNDVPSGYWTGIADKTRAAAVDRAVELFNRKHILNGRDYAEKVLDRARRTGTLTGDAANDRNVWRMYGDRIRAMYDGGLLMDGRYARFETWAANNGYIIHENPDGVPCVYTPRADGVKTFVHWNPASWECTLDDIMPAVLDAMRAAYHPAPAASNDAPVGDSFTADDTAPAVDNLTPAPPVTIAPKPGKYYDDSDESDALTDAIIAADVTACAVVAYVKQYDHKTYVDYCAEFCKALDNLYPAEYVRNTTVKNFSRAINAAAWKHARAAKATEKYYNVRVGRF